MPSKLSSRRLRALADLVRPGAAVADIGTDHGLLALHLVCSGRVPKVIASDNKRAPLEAARARIEAAGFENQIELRLGSGLNVLAPAEVETVVIAGIGGRQIVEMLRLNVARSIRRFVVQASRNHESVVSALAAEPDLKHLHSVPVSGRWPVHIDVFERDVLPE